MANHAGKTFWKNINLINKQDKVKIKDKQANQDKDYLSYPSLTNFLG